MEGARRRGTIPLAATVAAALALNAGCCPSVAAVARRFNIEGNQTSVARLAHRLAAQGYVLEGGDLQIEKGGGVGANGVEAHCHGIDVDESGGTGEDARAEAGEEQDEKWEVEEIIRERRRSGATEFLVHWAAGDKTWEPLEHVEGLEAFDAYVARMRTQAAAALTLRSGATLKEKITAPSMPPGTFVKEEGLVPPMPPDAFVKEEGVVPPMPLGAYVKEEEVAPPMPPGAFVKEGNVPPMPPDAVVKQEHEVVVEERSQDGRAKRQRNI